MGTIVVKVVKGTGIVGAEVGAVETVLMRVEVGVGLDTEDGIPVHPTIAIRTNGTVFLGPIIFVPRLNSVFPSLGL